MIDNIRRNDVTDIEAVNVAVSGDGRDLDTVVHFGSNSGGATSSMSNLDRVDHERFTAPSVTLDQIFLERGIVHCRLLKIDTEGSEHEALLNTHSLGRSRNCGVSATRMRISAPKDIPLIGGSTIAVPRWVGVMFASLAARWLRDEVAATLLLNRIPEAEWSPWARLETI